MAVWRQVLVELVNVEGVDGADDVSAELRDVDVTEVDVLTVGRRSSAGAHCVHRLTALVFGSHVQVCLRGGGRCWRPVRLTWNAKSSEP